MEVSEVNSVFVIGPIGSKFAPYGSPERESYEAALEVFEKVILPACDRFGLSPVRADQIAATGEINEQIFRHLRDDDIVIADLSGANPNVMYELGLRHTRPKLTVQIGEFGQLPFDVTAVRTIQFSRSERGLIEARKELELALDIGLAGGGDPVTATRVWLSEPSIDEEFYTHAGQAEAADSELPDEDGLIERIAKIEKSFPDLNRTTDDVVQVMGAMGEVATRHTTFIQNALALEVPTVERVALVDDFAKSLLPDAQRLEQATGRFDSQMREIDVDVVAVLKVLSKWPPGVSSFEEFLNTLVTLAGSSREAMSGLTQFESSVAPLALLSRSLREPVSLIQTSVRRMLDAIILIDGWEGKINQLRR